MFIFRKSSCNLQIKFLLKIFINYNLLLTIIFINYNVFITLISLLSAFQYLLPILKISLHIYYMYTIDFQY